MPLKNVTLALFRPNFFEGLWFLSLAGLMVNPVLSMGVCPSVRRDLELCWSFFLYRWNPYSSFLTLIGITRHSEDRH